MSQEKIVGKFKNIVYNEETDELDFTISVTDPKFKRKLLRDFALAGRLKVVGEKLVYLPLEDDKD